MMFAKLKEHITSPFQRKVVHILSDEADLNVTDLFLHLSNYGQCQRKLYNKWIVYCKSFFVEDCAL